MSNECDVPSGRAFLDLIWKHDEQIQAQTDARIQSFGKKAPRCFEAIGTTLSHLDRISSCFYKCHGGDHLVEYLLGRIVGLSRATIRLMRFGHYDEALSMVRTIGEMANLLQLFALSSQDFSEWKNSSKSDRISRYGPASVRRRLETLGEPARLDRDWYSSLCEWSAHPTPKTKPNAFNPYGIPVGAPRVQDVGILVCINELGRALCYVVVPAVSLIPLERGQRLAALKESRSLAENLGGVLLDQLPQVWSAHRETAN